MVKSSCTVLLFFLFTLSIFAESNSSKYIVYFKDKPSVENIEHYFSSKALFKRQRFNIPFDSRDYPVNTEYISVLKKTGVQLLNTSNWLNAVLIKCSSDNINSIKQLEFVGKIIPVTQSNGSNGIANFETEESCEDILAYEDNYVSSYAQVHLLNGEYLHELGFNGENMTIAICDNGFYNANTNPAFSGIFSQNRILGTYDYVQGDSAVYDESVGTHGSNCFSLIGGYKSNQYIGTATKSGFYLFHTENNSSERLQEEFNLATALERCSQLGVDVVNISLGYTTFDVASENHDSTDLMNNSTPAAKAVNMAASKGTIVCVAAGNEGNKPWKYISTPADADSAFAIASVDINGNVDPSSGYGLATDPRVKPNVAAMGWGANIINVNNQVVSGRGTSYASPTIAGLSACLWQAFPHKTAWEIKTAIEQSASQYLTPNKRMGYGIPDFKKAYDILSGISAIHSNLAENDFIIYPNPFKENLFIENKYNTQIRSIQLINQIGQIVYSENSFTSNSISLSNVTKGMYILQIVTDKGIYVKKLIKD